MCLARAVYANSDIMLLDDPISALDANVRKAVMKQVILGSCKEKTRVLVTHSLDFLSLTDRIAIVSEGKLVAFDTYDNLKDSEHLKHILKIHSDQV